MLLRIDNNKMFMCSFKRSLHAFISETGSTR